MGLLCVAPGCKKTAEHNSNYCRECWERLTADEGKKVPLRRVTEIIGEHALEFDYEADRILADDGRVYELSDLLPEECDDRMGRYRFRITVEATPLS